MCVEIVSDQNQTFNIRVKSVADFLDYHGEISLCTSAQRFHILLREGELIFCPCISQVLSGCTASDIFRVYLLYEPRNVNHSLDEIPHIKNHRKTSKLNPVVTALSRSRIFLTHLPSEWPGCPKRNEEDTQNHVQKAEKTWYNRIRKRIKRRCMKDVYLSDTGADSYICYAYKNDKNPVGSCELFIHGKTAKIENFAVIPSEQRKGYGSVLLKSLIDKAIAENAEMIYLETDEDDTAKEMYKKFGFYKTGEITDLLFDFTN